MRLAHLNLWSALLSLLGSVVWLVLGEAPSGLVWLAASLVWVALAIGYARNPSTEPHPLRRLARRVSRLLLFGS